MPGTCRIRPPSRPLRPPLNRQYRATRSRFFARNSQLLLVSRAATHRPQLVFLTSPRLPHLSPLQSQISRLISTETKRFIKEQSWLAGKYTFVGGVIMTAGLSWLWMLTQEAVDRDFPAPQEWSFLSKVAWHASRGLSVPSANLDGRVNWIMVGMANEDLLRRLEDPDVDGSGIVGEETVLESGVEAYEDSVIGRRRAEFNARPFKVFDVSSKSYQWKRGYYETLMGCLQAAIENVDSVLDISRNLYFREPYMTGPGRKPRKFRNPKAPSLPREEDCVPYYASPEVYFEKIRRAKGFTNKEKMDAAITYANWLDFSGRFGEAEHVYAYALRQSLPETKSEEDVWHRSYGSIRPDVEVTDNVVEASTAMAIHRAVMGDTGSALPLFLSIIRARRNAPLEEPPQHYNGQKPRSTKIKRTDMEALSDQVSSFWALLQASKFPDPPPSGNDPFRRTSENDSDEATIMAYIGEILFASTQRDAGLSWTKSATELAYHSYHDPRTSRDSKLKSVKCLAVSTDNRRKMVALAKDQLAKLERERERASWWRKMIPGLVTSASVLEEEKQRWEREELEGVDFDKMLMRGRVFDIPEEPAPLWGTVLLREWIIPHLR